MVRFSISDSVLLPVAIPGIVLLSGLIIILNPFAAIDVIAFIQKVNGVLPQQGNGTLGVLLTVSVAVAALVFFFLALFCGSVLAVMDGYIEGCILDPFQARRTGIEMGEYWKQWDRYIDSLESGRNSYISRQVDAFHVQVRLGVALLVLASAVAHLSLWATVGLLALAGLFFRAAWDDHCALAAFRNRRFAADELGIHDGEELVRRLISSWCSREAMEPLKRVLPHWPADTTADELQSLCDALESARSGGSVFESEKLTLRRAIGIFMERKNGLKPCPEE
jgi:hypothetical protein